MSGKYALIIANTDYVDTTLPQLTAPAKDAAELERVLKSPDICAFDQVSVLLNQPSLVVSEAIDDFLYQKKLDDLLLLYFSGHGIRDEGGVLYLAVQNTNHLRLRLTAIKSNFIQEAMAQSRSKRQVLVLDCCNSGAFLQGVKADTNEAMGLVSAFQGYGRVVLAASRATQFAWEGDKVIDGIQNSLFTHFLVKGLEGEADSGSDGKITVDELYDYAYDQISRVTPNQTPIKSAQQEGEIVLRHITRLVDIKPVSLPAELIEATEDIRTFVREGAVAQLEKYLNSKNLGLVRSARETLEKIETGDDSYRVRQAAAQILEPIRKQEPQKSAIPASHGEAGSIATLKTETLLDLQKAKDIQEVEFGRLAEEKVEIKTGKGIIDQQIKNESNPKTLERSLLLHLLSGTGLFQIGSQSLAKWLYPLAFLLMVIGFCVSPPLDLDYSLWKADLVSDGIAGTVGYISLFVYLIGFVDTWISFDNKTLQKSLLWHLVSGRGLLYTDSRTHRRWLYPLAFLVMIVGFSLCPPLDLDVKLWKHDIISDSFAATIGYVCLLIYLIGFIDTWLSLKNRSLQKSLVPQLLSGTGLFFSDSQPVRRWLYFSAFVLMIAAFSICPPLDLDSKLWNFDLVPDLVAGIVGYISLIIYFVGIYDTYMSYEKDEVARVANVI